MIEHPEFIHRDGMIADTDYVKWLADVKSRYVSAQAKAIVKVNSELLRFYWSIGRDLVAMHPEKNGAKA